MNLVDLVKNYRNSNSLTVTIVSPFVSKRFIATLVEKLSPDKMLVVADKRSELEIDEIAKIKIAGIAKVEVRLAECLDGIVHAKLFLFDWNNVPKIFVWGSANATESAFGKNAESVSLYKIRDSNNEPKSEIESYFEQLWQEEPKKPVEIKSHIAHLGDIRLLLPSFSLVEQQDSFDKWLEEGKLFDPDKYKTTLSDSVKTVRLKIFLKKDIKTKNLAKQHDFDCSEQKTLSYNKFKDVPNVDLPSIKDYAVNTMYGYWIPNQVVIWFGNKSPKSEIRMLMEGKIEALIGYIKTKREELIAIFMENLNALVEQVEGSLTDYFEDKYLSDHGNKLNIISIEGELRRQLNEHVKKCEHLREQPLETHDLFPVRFYLAQWDKFAVSFVRSIGESDSKKHGYRLGKIFIDQTQVKGVKQGEGKTKSKGKGINESLFPETEVDGDEQPKDFKQILILEQLRKGNWSVYRDSIHEAMEQELKQKLSNSKKKDTTSDTGQSQNNLI